MSTARHHSDEETRTAEGVPARVREEAALSLRLKKLGFDGGTDTGFARARKLAAAGSKPTLQDFKTMHAWFARHRITSYPGYRRWHQAGRPETEKRKIRGAVAWLLWGGDPGYRWVRDAGEKALRSAGVPFHPLPAILPESTKRLSPPRPRRSPKPSPRRRRP